MKRRVAILGATGIVGQRFVSILSNHPWFEISMLTAERSVGKKYEEAVKWVLEKPIPRDVQDMVLEPTSVDKIVEEKVDLVFVALPSDIAQSIEPELARRGIVVVSNASNMRMDIDIPLINPEVNADHIDVIESQRKGRGWSGAIIKVPNCTTAILTLSLKPIHDMYGVKRVIVSTMQGLSGAGLTGVPSMFILDNIIPYIESEEEKVETESLKIFGELVKDEIVLNRKIIVSASCHRIMVLEGHSLAVFTELGEEPDLDEVVNILEEYRGSKTRGLGLPTAPEKPVVVRKEIDRPQPRLDRFEGNGMSVVVGRIRKDRVFKGIKYFVVGHNTIRGAAGTGVLIGELLVKKGFI